MKALARQEASGLQNDTGKYRKEEQNQGQWVCLASNSSKFHPPARL